MCGKVHWLKWLIQFLLSRSDLWHLSHGRAARALTSLQPALLAHTIKTGAFRNLDLKIIAGNISKEVFHHRKPTLATVLSPHRSLRTDLVPLVCYDRTFQVKEDFAHMRSRVMIPFLILDMFMPPCMRHYIWVFTVCHGTPFGTSSIKRIKAA